MNVSDDAAADGLVVVDKPAGMTSHDVVARVRRLARTRRVGHAGTLDPMATGVLVLGVGKATRLLGHLALTEKEYDGTVRLGVSTVTDDAEGEETARADAGGVTEEAVAAAVAGLTGEIEQVPSSVSAVKVAGVRSYQRVRDGNAVDLPSRPVTVRRLDVTALRRSGDVVDLDVSVTCSSGTYVRALARDLGAALGVGGHLRALRRTRVGPYDLSVARTLDELAESFVVLPIAEAARRSFPARDVDADQARILSHGGPLPSVGAGPGPVSVFAPDGTFLALVEERGETTKAVAVFV
jgi:tRNA pseudouridine55 synthase